MCTKITRYVLANSAIYFAIYVDLNVIKEKSFRILKGNSMHCKDDLINTYISSSCHGVRK